MHLTMMAIRKVTGLKGLKDNQPGKLLLRFTAPKTGNYQFVVGGYNPIKAFDGKEKHKVSAKITIGL
jgi:hypothetical protein